jgi:hypothetical protein
MTHACACTLPLAYNVVQFCPYNNHPSPLDIHLLDCCCRVLVQPQVWVLVDQVPGMVQHQHAPLHISAVPAVATPVSQVVQGLDDRVKLPGEATTGGGAGTAAALMSIRAAAAAAADGVRQHSNSSNSMATCGHPQHPHSCCAQ